MHVVGGNYTDTQTFRASASQSNAIKLECKTRVTVSADALVFIAGEGGRRDDVCVQTGVMFDVCVLSRCPV